MDTGVSRHAGGADDLVHLDPDHPGFRDPVYRERRNEIARLALEYEEGQSVPRIAYTETEHGVWRTVWERLAPLHARLACREYLEGGKVVRLERESIPQLADVNQILAAATGIQMLPVAGLVSPRTFLSYLGRDIFLATQYIRHHSRPLYTPEPDVVHELIGHAATFANPELALLNRLFGEVTSSSDDDELERIGRVYWYTLEFGAVEEGGVVKAYGAGLLSSAAELLRLEQDVELRPLELEVVTGTPYDPTDFQPRYFVASSFDAMIRSVSDWLRSR